MPLPIILGIGAAVAGISGVSLGVSGAAKMSDAKKTSEAAQKMHEESQKTFKKKSADANEVMDRLGKREMEILSSFETFSDMIEKIQNRPDFKECQINDVSLPQYNAEELKQVSIGAGVLLGGLGGAAVGTAGGFAAAGATTAAVMALGTASTGTAIASLTGVAATNATLAALGGGALAAGGGGMALGSAVLGAATLGVGLLVGGAIFGVTGGKISEKADEAMDQAKKEQTEVARIVDYLDQLVKQASSYRETLDDVDTVYQEHLYDMKMMINYSERTDWLQYNDREKRLVQNTVMLVGLLYKMCKLQLVIPAKTEGALNRVDVDGAENCRRDAKMVLRKIGESATED